MGFGTCPKQGLSQNRESQNILQKISAYLSVHTNLQPLVLGSFLIRASMLSVTEKSDTPACNGKSSRNIE